jgi:hypothetical protein
MKQIDLRTVRALQARGFKQRSEWHWRKKLEIGAIDIWPTTGKLRWVGKTWLGGLDAVDKILATDGRKVPMDLREPAPKAVNSEDEGVWITIGADCPWNPTPGIRRLFHFETQTAAVEARAIGFVGIEDARQDDFEDEEPEGRAT